MPSQIEEEAITVAQYLLAPDIPVSERKSFEKYYLMFSKIMALGNIQPQHIMSFLIAFDEICMLLEMGLFEEARQLQGKQMMKMQLSRSIGGFHTIWTSGGYSRQEHIQEVLEGQQQQQEKTGRMKKFFKGRKK
jgi:hypothetical protein